MTEQLTRAYLPAPLQTLIGPIYLKNNWVKVLTSWTMVTARICYFCS